MSQAISPPGPPSHEHDDGTICMWVQRGGVDRWRQVDRTGWDLGPCPSATDAARLVEVRMETLLRRERERIAKEIESAADEWRGVDSPKGVAYRVALSDAAAIARGVDA